MPGPVPGIHASQRFSKKDVDGRDKPGHDEERVISKPPRAQLAFPSMSATARFSASSFRSRSRKSCSGERPA